MCLHVKRRSLPKIATVDIPVIKQLRWQNGVWATPYQGMEISENKILIPATKVSFLKLCEIFFSLRKIEEGFIHVHQEGSRVSGHYFHDRYNAEAYIPKGTLYIEGDCEEFAARKVVIRELPEIQEMNQW